MTKITKPSVQRGKQLFKINGRILRPAIVLFQWIPYLMINVKTGKKDKRNMWNLSEHFPSVYVNMKYNSRMYGSWLGLEPEYETKELSTGKKLKVEKRVEATPIQVLSWKLSCGLCYGQNDMNMSIRPEKLLELIKKAIKDGKVQDTGASYLFFMCRSCDLKHVMKYTPKDKWLIFPTQIAIKSSMIPIDEALRKSGSNWRIKTSVTVEDIIKAFRNK